MSLPWSLSCIWIIIWPLVSLPHGDRNSCLSRDNWVPLAMTLFIKTWGSTSVSCICLLRLVNLNLSWKQLCSCGWWYNHPPSVFFPKHSLLPFHLPGCLSPLKPLLLTLTLLSFCRSPGLDKWNTNTWLELDFCPLAGWTRKCKRVFYTSAPVLSLLDSHRWITSSPSFPQPDSINSPY